MCRLQKVRTKHLRKNAIKNVSTEKRLDAGRKNHKSAREQRLDHQKKGEREDMRKHET